MYWIFCVEFSCVEFSCVEFSCVEFSGPQFFLAALICHFIKLSPSIRLHDGEDKMFPILTPRENLIDNHRWKFSESKIIVWNYKFLIFLMRLQFLDHVSYFPQVHSVSNPPTRKHILFLNKTPAMHRDLFRLQLANDRHLIENLPPTR